MAPADTAGRPPRPALSQILDDLLTPIDSIEENSGYPDALAETKRQIKERLQPLFQAANCVLSTNNNFSHLGAALYPERTQYACLVGANFTERRPVPGENAVDHHHHTLLNMPPERRAHTLRIAPLLPVLSLRRGQPLR